MNRVLKFKQSADSIVHLTSDWHIFHNPKWDVPIWKVRGFNSVEESDEYIINSINDNVGVNDVLINLGDPTLNCSEGQFEGLLSRIKCQRIYLLFGNHNSPCWSIYRREVDKLFANIAGGVDQGDTEYELYPFRYRNLIFVGDYLEFVVDGTKCVASHYPIYSFNGQAKGAFQFFGHIHSNIDTIKQSGRKMDVGFDYHRKPISFNDAKKLLLKIPVAHEGHH